MKVNELHCIDDVNYKRISNCSSALDWIDPQNVRYVYSLNKS